MNKLLLNNNGRNHIKFFPMKDVFDDIPEKEGDQIRWCEEKFNELQKSNEAKRLKVFVNRKKGYMISVWELNGNYYLIQCLRNNNRSYNSTIYISKEKQDSLSIAEFLYQNIDSVMTDNKELLKMKDNSIQNERA